MNALPRLLGALVLATCAVASQAGTRQASFDVGITLLAYPHGTVGTCTSATTAGTGGGTVSVLCSGREFVAVSAGPGVPLGWLSVRTALPPTTGEPGAATAAGQLSTWRVINVQGHESALVVMVDF